VGLAVLGGGAPATADGEAVPEAWLLDAADLVGRAVARVDQGRPSLGRVAAVDADDGGARPCVRVQWSGAAAPKRLHLDAFRAKLDDGALAVADAPEAGAAAALRAENARLRAALDAR
jgi:hypothetical protein